MSEKELLPNTAIILAAGFGTRMLPATKSIAKPMLNVVDRPVIDYTVEDLVNAGIDHIVIVGKQHFEQIEEYFDRHLELESLLASSGKKDLLKSITKFQNIKFTFIRQKFLGGTGDAVKAALHVVSLDRPVIVATADDIIFPRSDLPEMLELYKKYPGTIFPVRNVPKEKVSSYGIAIPAKKIAEGFHQIKGIIEKPSIEKAPSTMAALSPIIASKEVLQAIAAREVPENHDALPFFNIVNDLATKYPTYIYETRNITLDGGNKLELIKAQIQLGLKDPDLSASLKEYIQSLDI